MEICSPVKINGIAPGITTFVNTCRSFAPRHCAALKYDSSIDSTPNIVFSVVTKNEARNAKNITGVSKPVNMMIASGTQAKIGIGRNISKTGKTYSRTLVDQPINKPRGTPRMVAKANATNTLAQLAKIWV